MRRINLRSVDLNLLVALNALLEERSVTKAADRIYLSQPAMSRALARLRIMFDDELLVQSGRTSLLTPKAERLRPGVRLVLSQIRELVTAEEFVPSEAEGTVTISASDAMIASFLAHTIKPILFEAPKVRFSLREPQTADDQLLRQGNVDLLLHSRKPPEDLFWQELLIDNRLSCVFKKGHVIEGKRMTRSLFSKQAHIAVDTAVGNVIASRLETKKFQARNVLQTSSFISAAAVVGESNWICTVPTIFALAATRMFDLGMADMPIKLVEAEDHPIVLYMIWHERCNRDALHVWVRGRLHEALREWRYT